MGNMVRFPVEKYASLEMNQCAFQKTGLVVSQTPLGFDGCENGMWVLANKATGELNPVGAVTDTPIGICYTTEKEYTYSDYGLKNHVWNKGDYPRVGIFQLGDTVTSNCFQYDESEFPADTSQGVETTADALYAALAAWATTPVYVAPVADSPVPQLTLSKPGSGMYGQVTKFYTVPNGEKGVKYEIVHM